MSESDDELMERLRRISANTDPVPSSVIDAARAALDIRRPEADLAELTFDSWSSPGQLVGMRRRASPGRLRQLTFVTDQVRLELEIDLRHRALVGLVSPSPSGGAELRHGSGTTPLDVDEHGRFSLAALPEGPASISVSLDGGEVVATEWLTL